MLRGIESLVEPDKYFDKLSEDAQDVAAEELEAALTELGIEIEDEEKLRSSSWTYFIYLDETSETIQSFIKMKHPAQLFYSSQPVSGVSLTKANVEILVGSGLLERALWPDLIQDPNVFLGVNCNEDVGSAVIGTPFEASLALYGGPTIGSYQFMPLEGFGYDWEGVDENATVLGGDWIDIDFFKESALAAAKCAREADFNYEGLEGTVWQRVTSLLAQGTAKDFSKYVKSVNSTIYATCLETWDDATNFSDGQSWANYYGQSPVLHVDRIKQSRWSKLPQESRDAIIDALNTNIKLEGVADFLAAIAYNPNTTSPELAKLKKLKVQVVNQAITAREMPKGIFPRP